MREIIILILIVAFIAGLMILIPEQPEKFEEDKLKKFSSYNELRDFLKTNLESYSYGGIVTSRAAIAEAVPSAEATKAIGSEDYSTTNIQVAGVDEADIVKNDGKYIYIVSGNKIVIVNAYPPEELRILSMINLDGTPTEIFVNNDKLVIFWNQFSYYPYPVRGGIETRIAIPEIYPYPYYPPKVFIYVYDISDRENPALTRNITLDGNYIDSRMIGDYVYAVINSPISNVDNITLPTIASNGETKTIQASEIFYFDIPDYSYMFTTLMSINTQNDQEDISDKVILMGATQNIFVSLNNIYITYQKVWSYYDFEDRVIEKVLLPNLPADVANEINNIKNSNLAQYEKYQKIGEVVFNYLDSLSEEERSNLQKIIEDKTREVEIEIQKEIQKTIIHRISIVDGKIEHEANGEVPGYVLNQFSMDEYNGYFRIATTTSEFFGGGIIVPLQSVARAVEETTVATEEAIIPQPTLPPRPTSYNNVYILDENLNIVGKLENLAPDETIFSARFLGDRAYLVTFRRIDPLFVIDLSNPTDPKVLGQLKIPGFSDYLHPYDENHVIGIGREVSEGDFPLIQGVKLGLFDVTDPTNPKEIAKYEIGSSGTDSEALRDHKAFLFSRNKNLLVIPILLTEKILPESFGYYVWQGAYVFDVSLENGFIEKGRVTHVPSDKTVEYYFFSPFSVKRSLYIDDILYTVSDKMIKANSLTDLNEIGKVELPFEEEPIPIFEKPLPLAE